MRLGFVECMHVCYPVSLMDISRVCWADRKGSERLFLASDLHRVVPLSISYRSLVHGARMSMSILTTVNLISIEVQ